MLAIACVGTVIITAVMYLNGKGIYISLITLPGGFEGFVLSTAMQLGMALPIILVRHASARTHERRTPRAEPRASCLRAPLSVHRAT